MYAHRSSPLESRQRTSKLKSSSRQAVFTMDWFGPDDTVPVHSSRANALSCAVICCVASAYVTLMLLWAGLTNFQIRHNHIGVTLESIGIDYIVWKEGGHGAGNYDKLHIDLPQGLRHSYCLADESRHRLPKQTKLDLWLLALRASNKELHSRIRYQERTLRATKVLLDSSP